MLAFQAHSVHVEPNSEATVETDAAADTEHEEVGLNHAELIEKMDVDAELSEETDAGVDCRAGWIQIQLQRLVRTIKKFQAAQMQTITVCLLSPNFFGLKPE